MGFTVVSIKMIYRRVQNFTHPISKTLHYNDLLDRQSFERGRDEVTYFYIKDVFGKRIYTLAQSVPIFKK